MRFAWAYCYLYSNTLLKLKTPLSLLKEENAVEYYFIIPLKFA